MLTADPLIRTKLRLPVTRPELVARPRLLEQVSRGLCGPLTLVTAPAGFGKTTLVAACLAACGMPAAWLSLDKNDNLSGRFLTYLVAAFQSADERIGREAVQMTAGIPGVSPEAVLTSLINDLDAGGMEMALVLDDYQLINSRAVHEQVCFLLEHGPDTFHLVVATRSDPPLPLARLRARGHLVELRAADLRFTKSEAVQFLNEIMGLRLDARAVDVLEERTEGWIAGLQMAALSMRGREDVQAFIQEFAGTNRFIMDFMLEEVLAREPQEVQDFLLQTSILSRLSGPLCDAVTGTPGGWEMLERLERGNLFVVPLGDDRRWYRYHHLFADLLQLRLAQSQQGQAAQLFARAADWCEQEGHISEAVSYAFAARDHARVAGLVEQHWHQMTSRGEIDTVFSWLNALPPEIVRDSAPLGAAICSVLWLTGQVGAIEPHLIEAERALAQLQAAQPADKENPIDAQALAELPAVLAALRSLVLRYHDDDAASAAAERALRLIPPYLPPEREAPLQTLAYLALASAYDGAGDLEKCVDAYLATIRWSRQARNASGVAVTYRMIGALQILGRLRDADAACRDALEYLQAQGMAHLPAAGILHVALSEVLVERNDLQAAQAHLAQGLELGKWSGRLDAAKNAASVLSRIRLIQGDTQGALDAIQETEAALLEPVAPLARAGLLALKADILVRSGDLQQAVCCVAEAEGMVSRDRGSTSARVALASARVLLAQNSTQAAAVRLASAISAAEDSRRFGAAIELRILRALALAHKPDGAQEAEADLQRALAMALPEDYARIFLDEGPPMQRLLARWRSHASHGPLCDYAARLLAQFTAEPLNMPTGQPAAAQGMKSSEPAVPSGNDALFEPLSQRELEVLALMSQGRTNQDIARNLVVARGTIKAHAASIYRKLDVANRTEAVARARQLGILP